MPANYAFSFLFILARVITVLAAILAQVNICLTITCLAAVAAKQHLR
jgi:hypothetical protein